MDELSQTQQNILLETLVMFRDLCNKLNIKYYLAFGTLLGAVRHKGFIPWDDDMDVMMHRKDYEILLDYLKNNPNEDYCIGSFGCGFFNINLVGKFYNKKRFILEDNKLLTNIFVDIFILSDVPNGEFENYLKSIKKAMVPCSLINESIRYKKPYKPWKQKFYKFIQDIRFRDWWNREKIEKNLYKTLIKYENDPCADLYFLYEPGIFKTPELNTYKKEWFNGTEFGEINGEKFTIPVQYDKFLKKSYGNYMELPTAEKRVFAHNNIFLKPNEHFVATYSYFGEK